MAWIAQIVPWVLVIIGWKMASRQIAFNTTRNEVRDGLDKLSNLLDKLEEDAYKYHCGSVADQALAAQIKRKLHRLGQVQTTRLSALENSNSMGRTKILVNLRRAITLDNFDVGENNFNSQPLNSEILMSTSFYVAQLIDDYENEFANYYIQNNHHGWCKFSTN